MTVDLAEATLTTLYAQHADRVRGVIAANVRPTDRDLVDDIAQDVWLQLWRRFLDGRDVATGGLLTTMAKHRVIDHYRLARVRRETCHEDMSLFAEEAAR